MEGVNGAGRLLGDGQDASTGAKAISAGVAPGSLNCRTDPARKCSPPLPIRNPAMLALPELTT